MDEFGIDLDNSENIGTSVSKLNETNLKKDYIENFKNNLETEKLSTRPKKHINMDKIIKNIEMDINNFDDYNNINVIQNPVEKNIDTIEDNNNNNIEYKNLIIYMLLFMLLNNKLIIEYVYKILVFIPILNSPVPNLILRTIIFGLVIYGSKKYFL